MDRAKPFYIAKREVWEAYKSEGQPRGGWGGRTVYRGLRGIWVRTSTRSGIGCRLEATFRRRCVGLTYRKAIRSNAAAGDSDGRRQIAQMVVKRHLEPLLEPVFHRDSYGYRPGKSAHDALLKARQRCWAYDWVLDLDIKGFFDEIDWDLLIRAVRRHTDCPWVLLYLERWLRAPVSMPNGDLADRESGTPQGAVVSPVLATNHVSCGPEP